MYSILKRLGDISISLIAITLFCPVFILIAIAIKLDSEGPVIFKQKRFGIHKKTFYVFKFRTMKVESPKYVATRDLQNPEQWITRVGAFLRKTSLDELPQLLNIIKGDMSIVGPRPLQQFEITHHILTHQEMGIDLKMSKRLSVKPGLLCYWQVTPNKNDMPFADRMDLDLLYIDNVSLKTDFLLILKGFFTVLMGNNS